MLRIAVPNKGSLSEAAGAMLHEAGYRRRSDRELLVVDPESGVELFYLRPRDIAVYVGSGRLDIGITGRDLLLDSRAEAEELLALGFGRSSFRFAGRPGSGSTLEDLKGKRIATSYPGIVQAHLDRAGVPAEVVKLDGAVEIAIQLGVADVIADVVDTGATLRQAGLELIGPPILESEAVVIQRRDAEQAPGVEQFLRRMQGVLVARKYVLMDYDIRAERLRHTFQKRRDIQKICRERSRKPRSSTVRLYSERAFIFIVVEIERENGIWEGRVHVHHVADDEGRAFMTSEDAGRKRPRRA